eukprot:2079035-Pyramimonas_sp.AAC.1
MPIGCAGLGSRRQVVRGGPDLRPAARQDQSPQRAAATPSVGAGGVPTPLDRLGCGRGPEGVRGHAAGVAAAHPG